MRILEILAHPREDSFNHAIAQTVLQALANQGHEVFYHDLYAESFDPVFGPSDMADQPGDPLVARHCDELVSADGVVVVHPSWWGQPPAMLKGWLDRVFRAGVAYRFEPTPSGEGTPVGMLGARHAVVLNTANSAANTEWGGLGDPLDTMWRNTVFGFCGVDDVRRKLYAPVLVSSAEQREEWLSDAHTTVQEVFRLVHT